MRCPSCGVANVEGMHFCGQCRQVERMVEQVAGGKALPVEVRQQVVAKTDGVPLFVGELTKMVLESGWLEEREDHYDRMGPLPPLAIPATLHDSLVARLDRMAPGKEVAQLGATLGRAFPCELLQAVSLMDEGALQQALAQLVEAELLYQRGMPPQATYVFKHALIQDAAYQSVLKRTRQQSHRRIAQVLAERFPETAETQPERLAYHYTEAGLIAQGLYLWGWALAQQGQVEEGMVRMRQGLTAWQATGAAIGQPQWLALLAEAYRTAGQAEEGLRVVAEALQEGRRTREQWYTAELYRLKGELLLMCPIPDKPQAATCFQQALEVARRQEAKSWELRAAMSLSRLWQSQHRCAEAREWLAPIYGWFTEGFDTADLKEAKALLAAVG
jgi:tetratricopeptide (TPR) repeat protein